MICFKCNNAVEDGALFCNKCGNKMQDDAFSSQSITESTTFMQANTQSDNLETIKTFLNNELDNDAKIHPESVKISSLIEEEKQTEPVFTDDISLEDTKEIEIPSNTVEVDLDKIVDNFIKEKLDDSCLDDLDTQDTNPSETRVETFEDTETLVQSPFKIPVSDESEEALIEGFAEIPHYPNPNINRDLFTQGVTLYNQPEEVDTLDLVVIFLFSLVPIIGLFVLLYLAFGQTKSKLKRKIASALLLTYVFIFVMAVVFFIGFTIGML